MTATATRRTSALTVDTALFYADAVLNSVSVTGSADWAVIMLDVTAACAAAGLPPVKNWLHVRSALQELLNSGLLTRDADITGEVYRTEFPAEPAAEPVAAEPAAELTARTLARAARYPSSFGLTQDQARTLTTAAGATVTIRPAQAVELAAIKAQILAHAPAAAPVRKPAASGTGSASAVTVRLTLSAGNPKAGQRGWFGEVCMPALRALAVDATLTRAQFVALFPARTASQLADSWAYLTQEGFAVKL